MEAPLLAKLLWPLARLILGLSCGLLLAAILESLRWTAWLGHIARPLAFRAHLGQAASSAFALAFVSTASANALLASKYAEGSLSRRELMLANLFNSLPAYLTHLPAILLMLWPVLGAGAILYAVITFSAAFGRTLFIMCLGAILLPQPLIVADHAPAKSGRQSAHGLGLILTKAWPRFRMRLPSLLFWTIPVYIAVVCCQELGAFRALEAWLAANLDWLAFLRPQAMGIVGLQLVADTGATLGAAAAAIQDTSLAPGEVVVAMLTGNVLSTPVRAIRHQLPAYCGLFSPGIAIRLVLASQALRAGSIAVILAVYIIFWL